MQITCEEFVRSCLSSLWVANPVIPSVTHHRQNHLECTYYIWTILERNGYCCSATMCNLIDSTEVSEQAGVSFLRIEEMLKAAIPPECWYLSTNYTASHLHSLRLENLKSHVSAYIELLGRLPLSVPLIISSSFSSFKFHSFPHTVSARHILYYNSYSGPNYNRLLCDSQIPPSTSP